MTVVDWISVIAVVVGLLVISAFVNGGGGNNPRH